MPAVVANRSLLITCSILAIALAVVVGYLIGAAKDEPPTPAVSLPGVSQSALERHVEAARAKARQAVAEREAAEAAN